MTPLPIIPYQPRIGEIRSPYPVWITISCLFLQSVIQYNIKKLFDERDGCWDGHTTYSTVFCSTPLRFVFCPTEKFFFFLHDNCSLSVLVSYQKYFRVTPMVSGLYKSRCLRVFRSLVSMKLRNIMFHVSCN